MSTINFDVIGARGPGLTPGDQATLDGKVAAAAGSAAQAAAGAAQVASVVGAIDQSQPLYFLGRQLALAETFADLTIQRAVWLDGAQIDFAPAIAGDDMIGSFVLDASEAWYDPASGKQIARATVASDLSILDAALLDGSPYPGGSSRRGLAAWGDSITAGSWPEKLAKLLGGCAWFNGGIGGQTTPQIAGRQGAVAYGLTVSGNQLAAGANTVTAIDGVAIVGLASAPASNAFLLSTPGDNATRSVRGTLGSVHGTLTRTATGGPPSTAEGYTFTPDAGSRLPARLPAGTAFVIDNDRDDDITILWPTRNDYAGLTLAQIAANDRAMVARLPHKRFVILPVLNGSGEPAGSGGYAQILAIEQQRAALFPANFLNIRRLLIDRALADLGITPTTQDAADIANDIYPASLRRDALHPNTTSGDAAIALYLAQFITAKGW